MDQLMDSRGIPRIVVVFIEHFLRNRLARGAAMTPLRGMLGSVVPSQEPLKQTL
jgi:hypothetical protein